MSWQTTVCSHPVQYIDRSCVYSTRVNSHVSRAQHHTSHKLGSSFGAHRVPSLCPASLWQCHRHRTIRRLHRTSLPPIADEREEDL